jgi:hypothetical protein
MNGKTRKLSLDRYIWLCTRGLPKNTRLDTAAELRVHVLERIRMLEGQGFPRAEAEHVAVSEMGLPEGTNRAFLGHFFTYKLGWMVLGLGVLGAGIWWSKDNLFAKTAGVQSVPLSSKELSAVLSNPDLREMKDFNAFRIVMPENAVGFEITLYHNKFGDFSGFLPAPYAGKNYPESNTTVPSNYRHEFTVIVGARANTPSCPYGLEVAPILLSEDSFNKGSEAYIPGKRCFMPSDGYHIGSTQFISYSSASLQSKLELNRSFLAWNASFGPKMDDCHAVGIKETPSCSLRSNILEESISKPNKHWDRNVYLSIRAVDEKHKTIIEQSHTSSKLGFEFDKTKGHYGAFVEREFTMSSKK